MIFLKFLCMFLMIMYGFSNMGKLIRGLPISNPQMMLMSLGAAGYILLTQLGY